MLPSLNAVYCFSHTHPTPHFKTHWRFHKALQRPALNQFALSAVPLSERLLKFNNLVVGELWPICMQKAASMVIKA